MNYRLILLISASLFVACAESNNGLLTPSVKTSFETIIKIGLFKGQNGFTTTGNFEIKRNDTSFVETFVTWKDFVIDSSAGNVELYLTDDMGAVDLSLATIVLKLGNITSGFSGEIKFVIPNNNSESFNYAVLYSPSVQLNLGSALIILPQPN